MTPSEERLHALVLEAGASQDGRSRRGRACAAERARSMSAVTATLRPGRASIQLLVVVRDRVEQLVVVGLAARRLGRISSICMSVPRSSAQRIAFISTMSITPGSAPPGRSAAAPDGMRARRLPSTAPIDDVRAGAVLVLMNAIRGPEYLSSLRQTVSDCGSTPATKSKNGDRAVEDAEAPRDLP